MSRPIPQQALHDSCYRIKRRNKDGSINSLWMNLHQNGRKNGSPKQYLKAAGLTSGGFKHT